MKIFSQRYLTADIFLLSAILISAIYTDFNSINSSPYPNNYSSSIQTNPGSGNKIIVVGDLQKTSFWEKLIGRESNDEERKLIVNEISKENPAMLVLLGDLVFDGSSASDWEEFDELIEPIAQKNIIIKPVLGNHDYWGSNKSALKNFSERFEQFKSRHWYSLRFDSLALIFLDSNIDDLSESDWNEQKNWFENQLKVFDKDNSVKGIFVFLHHPPYTNSTVTCDEIHVQKYFVNPFSNSVKSLAMISGHAHGYERFYKNRKTFVVSGGGGGPRVDLKHNTEESHHDLLANDPDTSDKRPFNFLIITRNNETIEITVKGLLKNTSEFFILEKFRLPVTSE